MPAHVASLHIYPVKSCGGIRVEAIDLTTSGPAFDRHWMVVDESGEFVSQREVHALARVQSSLDGNTLRLTAPSAGELVVDESRGEGDRVSVRVWGFEGKAILAGAAAHEWFSAVVGVPVRLVQFDPAERRHVSRQHTGRASLTEFSDGYPLLLLSQASLDDLNGRLEVPVPMNRFRPNVVVDGVPAYAEDGWREISVGGTPLDVAKACERCVTTTVDQSTAVAGKDPLRTLARYRRVDGRVVFGQNCVHHGSGRLAVGAPVEVLR